MFSILISTKNRKKDLLFTLLQIEELIARDDVECVVFDDGSDDGTSQAVRDFPAEIKLLRNERSKGYLYCRNLMLNSTKAEYAISLDDDAHFLSENPLEKIHGHFENHPKCGVIAFRIFWGHAAPQDTATSTKNLQVKSFIGCGHAWRMEAWRDIPDYPEWFGFYGEENVASLQLFSKGWHVEYVPDILVQHRVDLKARAKAAGDFALRYRRSIRAGWYFFLLFYPMQKLPGNIGYSIWAQLRKNLPKGNFKVLPPLFRAMADVMANLPKIKRARTPLTPGQYRDFGKLNEPVIYWTPEK